VLGAETGEGPTTTPGMTAGESGAAKGCARGVYTSAPPDLYKPERSAGSAEREILKEGDCSRRRIAERGRRRRAGSIRNADGGPTKRHQFEH